MGFRRARIARIDRDIGFFDSCRLVGGMDMTMNQIRYVVEIARSRSFSKAASRLYVSQSTLSAAIRQLEDELGIPIFARGPGGAALTKEGKRVFEHAANILHETDALLAHYKKGEPFDETLLADCLYSHVVQHDSSDETSPWQPETDGRPVPNKQITVYNTYINSAIVERCNAYTHGNLTAHRYHEQPKLVSMPIAHYAMRIVAVYAKKHPLSADASLFLSFLRDEIQCTLRDYSSDSVASI